MSGIYKLRRQIYKGFEQGVLCLFLPSCHYMGLYSGVRDGHTSLKSFSFKKVKQMGSCSKIQADCNVRKNHSCCRVNCSSRAGLQLLTAD